MNLRLLNILLFIMLLVVGIFNLNPLLHSFNEAFGWHLRLPIGEPYVTQEFRYRAPTAGEVNLVWGEQGWQQVPEPFRPPGTVIEYGVLNTPMMLEGDTFVAQLRLPTDTVLDYGFQTRSTRDSASIAWIWDGDYQQTLTTDNLIEVQAGGMPSSVESLKPEEHGPVVTPQFRTIVSLDILWQVPLLAQLHNNYLANPVSDTPLSIVFAALSVLVIGIGFALTKGSAASGHRRFSIRRWIYLRDLIGQLVGREMKLRYRRSLLGVAWSLINPLLQLLIFSFVFRYILPLEIPNYSLFLFSGLLVWNWLQGSLLGATTAIIDSGSLLKQPNFPPTILPIVTVAANFIHFLLALPILFLFLWLTGITPTFALWFLPIIMALQFLFTLGLAYFLATIHVLFRDTQHLVVVLLLFFFYLTPIFYDAAMIPVQFRGLYDLNPILRLIEAYRAILLYGEVPALVPLGSLALVSTLLLFWGWQSFRNASYQFVEEL